MMGLLPKRLLIGAAVSACVLSAGVVAWDWWSALPADAIDGATYVGRQTCAECHVPQHELWLGSHHDRAMELASEESVLGDFNDATFTHAGVTTRFFRDGDKFMANTEGPDGQHHDYQIKYTFGVEPLQQYMVEFPRGRVQVLRVSWDTQRKRWFEVPPPDVPDDHIAPGDPVHWTGIGQNWNTTCADCHSTNLRKGYDAASDSYHTTFAEIDVSCEECHGPGSVHVDLASGRSWFWDRKVGYGLPRLKSVDPSVQLTTCAKCHSRRDQVQENFRPGKPLLDHYVPALVSSGLYFSDGQILEEVYEYGSFLQSKMYAQRVRCSECHDPHSLKLKFQGNQLCAQCHIPGKYDTPAHHHHAVGSAGAQCVECHMPARLYMVIDSRRDHSFRVPRPDLSVKLGTPNACTGCHTKSLSQNRLSEGDSPIFPRGLGKIGTVPDGSEETNEWAAETVRKWYGEKRPDDPNWAPAFAAARDKEADAEQLLLNVVERKSTPAIVRASAIDLLAGSSSPRSVLARRQALSDPDPFVRRTAVTVASGDDLATLEADLFRRLGDATRAVRVSAAVRLAYFPREGWSNSQHDAFAAALDEYRASQSLALDHAGGHLALGALDRHLSEQFRAARNLPRAAELEARAVEHWRSAIRVEPYISGPRGELSNILEQRGGEPSEVRRLREEEVRLLERDTKLDSENGSTFYRLAMMQFLSGQLDEATESLETACRLMPQDYTTRLALALVYQRRYESTGDDAFFDAAVRELNLLRQLAPRDPQAGSVLQNLLQTRQSKLNDSPTRERQ
jgi:predicted CXXCH cytochrome family protein